MTLKETEKCLPKMLSPLHFEKQYYFPLQSLIYNKQHFKNTFIAYTFLKNILV